MGAAGTDVALETADVALMADDLGKLPAAIRLALRATRTIHQNVALSLATVAILVTAALTGRLSLTSGLLLNEAPTACGCFDPPGRCTRCPPPLHPFIASQRWLLRRGGLGGGDVHRG
jgi:hypothetical protein